MTFDDEEEYKVHMKKIHNYDKVYKLEKLSGCDEDPHFSVY